MRLLILLLLAALLPGLDIATMNRLAREVADLPVLHEGRLKPLLSLARAQLLPIHEKSRLGLDLDGDGTDDSRLTATAWLMESLCDQASASARLAFTIRDPQLVNALGLRAHARHRYSFDQLDHGLRAHEALVQSAWRLEPEQRDLLQRRLVELAHTVQSYRDLSDGLSCLVPMIDLSHPPVAAWFGLSPGHYSYHGLLPVMGERRTELMTLLGREPDDLQPYEQQVVQLLSWMHAQSQRQPTLLAIVPLRLLGLEDTDWETPWETLARGPLGSEAVPFLAAWEALVRAWTAGDAAALQAAATDIRGQTAPYSDPARLSGEVRYYRADWFAKSLGAYLLAFVLLALSWLVWARPLRGAAVVLVVVGLLAHALGIGMRIWIMQRPPVATLYESIIFVAFIAVSGATILEWLRRDGLGLLIATTTGVALHLLGMSYASEGDTMGRLVAVLNSNFWLATHVVTISIGYGCAFMAGLMGHVYLVRTIGWPDDEQRLRDYERSMVGLSLVALFFTLFGTILGGIWADQSWGRFWGWDPKENGALWIVLWLLMLVHGRIAEIIPRHWFAAGLVLLNVIVALAWFGVNLLSVGLHSYGFTDSIAVNLGLFTAGELTLALILLIMAQWRAAPVGRRS